MLTDQYALYGLATARGSLPGARTVGWAAGILAHVTVLLLFFLFLLFPDGRLPSRRWRPVLWAVFVVMAGRGGADVPGWHDSHRRDHRCALGGGDQRIRTRWGFSRVKAGSAASAAVSFVLGVPTGVLVVASVFVRRRGRAPNCASSSPGWATSA